MQVLIHRAPDFAIGRVVGAQALGVFRVASDLAMLPTNELVAPINRAVFPGYSILTRDYDRLRETFVDIVALVAMIALPAGLGIAAVAEPLVLAAFGERWSAAIDVVALLGIYYAFLALGNNASVVFMATGKVRLLMSLTMMRAIILVPAVILMVDRFALMGAVWAMVAVALIFMPILLITSCRLLRLPVSTIVLSTWRPLVAGCIMYASVDTLMQVLGTPEGIVSALLNLLAGIAVGGGAFLSTVLLLWLISARPEGPETLLTDYTYRQLRTAFR